MVEQSVGGEVELNYAPSGLMWRLTCPAANALEPKVTVREGKIDLMSTGEVLTIAP
jgi:hypothetical protein